MNHYCTLFDRRYAPQGFALWLSLRRHDPDAVLWVLALDELVGELVEAQHEPGLRLVSLAELESAAPGLGQARNDRSWIEFVFTLSPCLPLFLLERHPEIGVITYLDADLAFFSSPAPIFEELGPGSVLIVGHRCPGYLRHVEWRGRFNVGLLVFRNDGPGRACLADWRRRCLEWCHDRLEAGRYADQKYLDAWPEDFPGVVICRHPGVNLAPWNWMNYDYGFEQERLLVDRQPLVVFHFARFRPLGQRRADSGQLEYGIMPLRLRTWLYGRYWEWLNEARGLLAPFVLRLADPTHVGRGFRSGWKNHVLALLFGPVWWRVGPWWISGRLGLGRCSGRALAWWRRVAGTMT